MHHKPCNNIYINILKVVRVSGPLNDYLEAYWNLESQRVLVFLNECFLYKRDVELNGLGYFMKR